MSVLSVAIVVEDKPNHENTYHHLKAATITISYVVDSFD